MSYMFYCMSNLTTLNLSGFDTLNVTDMQSMFFNMSSLTSLDLSSFNTSNVTNMDSMFTNVFSLASLNLSGFDTSNVTDMGSMFANMSSLTSLDLSSFNTSKVTDMGYMFSISDYYESDDKLNKIYVNNDFNTAKLTSFVGMFENRKMLRGGNGSFLADPSIADKSWLRIDDPANGRPGYFTRKP